MIIYGQNKESLIDCEKLIHSRRRYLESNYRCEKWADILEHQNGLYFALPVDFLALDVIDIPDNSYLIDSLPEDFNEQIII